MEKKLEQIRKSAEYILSSSGTVPEIAMVLGSGLGFLAELFENSISIGYDRIPGFSASTVPGHAGMLVIGELYGRKCLAMKGRFHYYEGYDIEDVVFPIRAFGMAGIKNLILTNAAGGVNPGFSPGELMAITDHLSFGCPSPLRGPNADELGLRFPDMGRCYNRQLLVYAAKCAKAVGVELRRGVYSFSQGPMFETPAEIRALRILGADAVGMSTVPEAITANHMGMNVLAISCITNMAAGMLDQPLTHQEVMETAKIASENFAALIKEIVMKWGENDV